ncbi:MAG TPA: alkaline phosphatase D family protein [Nevskiaceae bacterium]|nr:alkaline phosphatase D family protein [Nevskiaceae bacterium]
MSAPRRRRGRAALRSASRRRPGLTRRELLKRLAGGSALLGAGSLLAGCGNSSGARGSAASTPFLHGVASGDPLSDRVILWTRVTPVASEDIPVSVTVYADPALSQPVGSARQTATAARDWTIKIDFSGLAAATTYYYRFSALGFDSVIGRTRTAPTATAERLRFGLVSCSSYAHGFFNAYRFLAQRADLDAVIHLGDYIYEYASDPDSGDEVYGTARPYEPTFEMKTLADYRTRHGYYKRTDPDLQELHRQHPMISIWDDHESTDNSWRDGAVNHNEDGKDEGVWTERKAQAQQAYDEWMPIRYPEPGNVARIWRRLSYGGLAEIFLTDTRLFDRDEPLAVPVPPLDSTARDPDRRLLGAEQREWLLQGLAESPATWKLVGNQVVFHQWSYQPGLKEAGGPAGLNGDAWDGYIAERQLIIDALRSQAIDNVVILTGDVHSSWVADITDDPNNPLAYTPDAASAEPGTYTGSVAVEYVVTSVTSPSALPGLEGGENAFRALNPHIKRLDLANKGYALLDVTPERVVGEYWFVSTIAEPGGSESFAFAYPAPVGENRIRAELGEPTAPPASPPLLAP